MRTVILKLSGDALRDPDADITNFGARDEILTTSKVDSFCQQIQRAASDVPDLRIGIVVGGGNIVRGRDFPEMDDVSADHMGMLATIINSIAIKDGLRRAGAEPRVMSGLDVRGVAEPYIYERARRHFAKSRVIVFAGGTGNPFVTTDSAAAQRAQELQADVLLVAKNNANGVYSGDPRDNPAARRFKTATFRHMIENRLAVMDAHAIQTCLEARVPLFVFDINDADGLYNALVNEDADFGTWVSADDSDPVEYYPADEDFD